MVRQLHTFISARIKKRFAGTSTLRLQVWSASPILLAARWLREPWHAESSIPRADLTTGAVLDDRTSERPWGGLLVAAVFAVLLIGIGLLNRNHITRVEQAREAVAHTYEVAAELSQTLASLIDAETGQRGFLITGEERYLAPYRAATAEVNNHLQRLADLTADNREQQPEIADARRFSAEKLAELELTIAVRRQDGLAAAQRIVATDRGMDAMDALRAIAARMRAREEQLLAARLETARRSSQTARWTSVAATGLAIGAVALTLMGYRRYATERARAAAVVAREREQLRVTLLGIGDAVIVVDRFSHVTLMNPVAEAITGWTMADAIDKPIGSVFRIVNEETRREVHDPIAVVLESGATQGLANHTLLIARDGVERPVDDSAAPLRDASGDLVGAVLVFRDVSARRADEKRLHRALAEAEESKAIAETRQQDLEEALQIKNQFLAAVSHELRTPINAIMGWSAMLRQGTVSADRIGGAIASLDRSARDLGKLIEDLLESSRLLTGKVRIARDAVDLHEVARDAVDSVRLGAENKGVVLDLDLGAVPPVRGDRERLKQVLWNVLGNAIKFTPRDGHVSLAMAAGGDHVKVTISDTGVGITESLLPHVFDHFRQGDEASGLGLGLAIARQVIEMHGGTIEAQSAGLNLGSTFVICLPVATADNVEAADQP